MRNKTSRKDLMKYIIYVLLIGLIIPGVIGCDDNNGGGQGGGSMPPEASTGCIPSSTGACSQVIKAPDGDYYSCIVDDQTCAVDLMSVIDAISASFTTVTGDTTMWIEAWGGGGGSTNKGTSGGTGGYAITTTTVNDIAGINNDSTVIYYFLGGGGANDGDHCGSAGGAATIVTLEDLMLNPSSDPTQSSPPILLVAGGGGGGCGGNGDFGCINPGCLNSGGDAGIAIASLNTIGGGTGAYYYNESGITGQNGGGMGTGGISVCFECGGGNETSGNNGYGGLGGEGGSGQDCTGSGTIAFTNTPVNPTFTAGQGGNGSSNTSMCDSGGGGGGGGWGGGGGGGHGNDNSNAIPGGGGGSFAIASTVSSDLSPTSRQTNPCGGNGCLRISFAP